MHFELARRVEEVAGRLDLLHRLTGSWDTEIYNLRSDLSSALNYNNKMIQRVLDWATDHDLKENKREWLQATLMFLNLIAIVVSLFAISHK
jgi:hypothetical protein